MNFIYCIDLLGTAVFAVSGVLLAGKMRMDPFGVLVLATVTAVGGGTMRDIILDARPIFWMADPTYLYVILCTSLIAMLCSRLFEHIHLIILSILDAIGLAVFVGIGVNKALDYAALPITAVLMGIMTGVGGGMIRDVLAREIPMVLQKEVYATACLVGAVVHVMMSQYGLGNNVAFLCGCFCTLSIRLTAIYYRLSLPTFSIDLN